MTVWEQSLALNFSVFRSGEVVLVVLQLVLGQVVVTLLADSEEPKHTAIVK